MEDLTLSFDLSANRLTLDEASDVRRDLSTRIDCALKTAGAGKWSGCTSKLDFMEIFIKATDPEKALDIIRTVLADHWVFPLMEVRRQT